MGQGRDSAWALKEDFNEILDNSEKEEGPSRCEGSFIPFRSFVSSNGLWDVKHTGNEISWRGKRNTHDIKSRLDRFLANLAWAEMFPASCSNYLRFEGSDHRPLITYLDSKKVKKRKPFRYDRRLNENEEARKIIEEAWKKELEEDIAIKISRCRREIIKWSKIQKEVCAKAVLQHQQELERELTATIPNTTRILELSEALGKAYKDEELFWRQRSRILWLQGGDRNNTFFHVVTKGRKARNCITTIESAEGVPLYEEEEIGKVFESFYQNLFSSIGVAEYTTVEETILPVITGAMNDSLCRIPEL